MKKKHDKITINRDYVRSELVGFLPKDHFSGGINHTLETKGTILIQADEIFLDPTWVLSYNNKDSDVRFPGRYHLTIVAARFFTRGGRIDLTGFKASEPVAPLDASDGIDFVSDNRGAGRNGAPGQDNKRKSGDGMNIKIFCEELVDVDDEKLVDIQIISNGGPGGNGGRGGNGGNGGRPKPLPGGGFALAWFGGNGGDGGRGGPGGNAGKIELFFCKAPNGFIIADHLISNGGLPGRGGIGGRGGEHGLKKPDAVPKSKDGRDGPPGDPGVGSTPNIIQLEPVEFFQKVVDEVGIPVPEPGEE